MIKFTHSYNLINSFEIKIICINACFQKGVHVKFVLSAKANRTEFTKGCFDCFQNGVNVKFVLSAKVGRTEFTKGCFDCFQNGVHVHVNFVQCPLASLDGL